MSQKTDFLIWKIDPERCKPNKFGNFWLRRLEDSLYGSDKPPPPQCKILPYYITLFKHACLRICLLLLLLQVSVQGRTAMQPRILISDLILFFRQPYFPGWSSSFIIASLDATLSSLQCFTRVQFGKIRQKTIYSFEHFWKAVFISDCPFICLFFGFNVNRPLAYIITSSYVLPPFQKKNIRSTLTTN